MSTVNDRHEDETKMSSQHKEADALQLDACWKVLERAAASPQLRRATRAREFLFYVAGKSLKEGCTEIHEQEIGHVVFGRNEDYDTSQDNIVRVSATELRKRIDSYFASEGAEEPLVFEIPRGSYVPVFRLRSTEPQLPQTEETPGSASTVISKSSYRRLPLVLVSAVAILLAIGCAFLWRENQAKDKALHPLESKPALAAFWPRFLDSSRETDIILADTSFALIEDISKHYFPLSDYLNDSYVRQIQSFDLSPDRKADLSLIAVRNNGSLGDFRVAQRIRALDPTYTRLVVEYAREYTADSIKRHNVILIGSQKSNPWVDLFYSQMTYTIEYDPARDQSFIRNNSPRPGEQSVYPVVPNPDAPVGYSIIAYLPNPSHTADALIIAGSNSQATDAAGEFLTSEASMEKLLSRFPSKQIPYFEVLLKTMRLSGTPFSADIVTLRTY
jgi:hypothetical protein